MSIKIGDFTIGIVAGLLLTMFGSLIQFRCNKSFYKFQVKEEKIDMICKLLDERLHVSGALIETSYNEKFEERWDYYIINVIYRWNRENSTMDFFINKEFPEEYDNFKVIVDKFKDLHWELNTIRKKQDLTNDQLKPYEDVARATVDTLTDLNMELKNALWE